MSRIDYGSATEAIAAGTTLDVTPNVGGEYYRVMNGTLDITGQCTKAQTLEVGDYANELTAPAPATIVNVTTGSKFRFAELMIGDGDNLGNVHTVNVDGQLYRSLHDDYVGCHIAANGVLNINPGATYNSYGFELEGVMNINGSTKVTLYDSLSYPQRMIGTEVPGRVAELNVVNGGSATIQGTVNLGYNDGNAKGKITVDDGSKLTIYTLVIDAGSSFYLDGSDSMASLRSVTVNEGGEFILDLSNCTDDTRRLVISPYTSSTPTLDYAGFIKDFDASKFTIYNNNLYLGGNMDMTKWVVDTSFAGAEYNTAVGENQIMGINGFSDVMEAFEKMKGTGVQEIKLASDISTTITKDIWAKFDSDVVLTADKPVELYFDVVGAMNLVMDTTTAKNPGSMTIGENVTIKCESSRNRAIFFGYMYAPTFTVAGTVESADIWIGSNDKKTRGTTVNVTETGRLLAYQDGFITREGMQLNVNGAAALNAATEDRLEQIASGYGAWHCGDFRLNNTLVRVATGITLGTGYLFKDTGTTVVADNTHIITGSALVVKNEAELAADPIVHMTFANYSYVKFNGGNNTGTILVDNSKIEAGKNEFVNTNSIDLVNGASWNGTGAMTLTGTGTITVDATSSLAAGALNIQEDARVELIAAVAGPTVTLTNGVTMGNTAALVIDVASLVKNGEYTLIKGFGTTASLDGISLLNAGNAVASVNAAGDLVLTIDDGSRIYDSYFYTEDAASTAVTNDDGTMSLKITNLDDAANRKTVKNDQAIVLEGVAADEEAQVKELTFTVDNAAAKLNFSLTSRAGRLNVQLVDAQGKVVAEQAVYNGLTRGFANQDLEQGTYTLKVAAHDKTAGGAFDFSWHLDDGVNQEQALTLDGGTSSITTEGYISTVTGSQDYTFTVASGSFDKYEISLAGMKRNLSLTILDAQQNEVYTMATGLPTKAVVSLGEGDYTMKVAQYGTSSSYTNEYELTLKKLSSKSLAMVSAADDTIANAKSVKLGADHTDWVGTGDTIDWIKVDLGASDYGRRALTFTGSEDYVTARLYRVAQGDTTLKTALLSTISSSDGKATVRNVNFADGYDYYLRVTATSGRNVEAGYTLNIASA